MEGRSRRPDRRNHRGRRGLGDASGAERSRGVGVYWIGLDRTGYGIHGTPKPEDIGKTESHGCFRLANWNVEALAKMIETGTPVVIEP